MAEQPDQLDMPVHDDQALFATDEELDRRLQQLENGLADIRARLAVVKQLAHPEAHRAQGSEQAQRVQGSDGGDAGELADAP